MNLEQIKLNEKYVQYYNPNPKFGKKGYINNIILLKPSLLKDDNSFGEIIINGTKICLVSSNDLIEVLKKLSTVIKRDDCAIIIHVVELNHWFDLNLKLIRRIFEINSIVGFPEILKISTKKFELVELKNVIDYDFNDSTELIYEKILKRLKDGVLLPQIAYSYAYGSYRLFKRKEKKAWNSMWGIVGKHARMGLYVENLYEEMKKKPSLIYTNETFKLFEATEQEPIIYIDRHDCWDYYLLTEDFPLTSPVKERKRISYKRLMELKKENFCFDFEATFFFEELFYNERIPVPNSFQLDLNCKTVQVTGTEITLDLLKEFFKGSLVSKVKVKSIFYYEKKGKLPEEYLEAISRLIVDKHTAPAETIERLRAKECLKIQIGKGLGQYYYPIRYSSEALNSKGKLTEEIVPIKDFNKLRTNKFKNRCLTPQISIRCQQQEYLHILRVVKELYAAGCDVLYVDTDGIIFIDRNKKLEYFSKLNREIKEKLPEKLKEFSVGLWDYGDKFYSDFFCFGKKQYILNSFDNSKVIHIARCSDTSSLENFDMKQLRGKIVEFSIPNGLKTWVKGQNGISIQMVDFYLRKEAD